MGLVSHMLNFEESRSMKEKLNLRLSFEEFSIKAQEKKEYPSTWIEKKQKSE